jgi:large subunit ribosomal protein L25
MSSSSGLIQKNVPPVRFDQTAFRYHALPLMAATESTPLSLTARAPEGSRSARRLRRDGLVPGVVYGGGEDPQHFAVDARTLRNTLAHAGQVIEVAIEGGSTTNVLIKDVQRHPVRGQAVHVDLLRVRMDQVIHATVPIEFTGADEAPGVVEGGIFNQELRELNIEALPGDIPDSVTHDVSGLEMNATLTLEVLTAPEGVTLLDEPETVIATITPPTLEPVEEEIETETEVVGEEGEAPAEAAEGETGEEAAPPADSDES